MIKKLDFPVLHKKPSLRKQNHEGSCGPNCMRHIIFYYTGLNIPEESLIKIGNTSKKSGTSLEGMIKIANKFNLSYESKYNSSISELINSIRNENLAVLSIQAWPNRKIRNGNWKNTLEFGHYVAAYGYNNLIGKLYYYDSFDGIHKDFSYKKLEEVWHDDEEHFGIFFK